MSRGTWLPPRLSARSNRPLVYVEAQNSAASQAALATELLIWFH